LVDETSLTTPVDGQSKQDDDTNITSSPTEGSTQNHMSAPIVSVVDTKNDDAGDSITSINQDFKVCYGNNEDFHEMMTEFWPCIHEFMENESNHEHTKQWSRWIAQGLTSGTNLSVVKSLMGIETFDQFYLFLRDSPALNTYYDISWDHKIIYQKKSHPIPTPEYNDRPTPKNTSTDPARIYHIRVLSDDDMDFCIFHKRVYTEITAWHNGEQATTDLKWMQWRKWMFAGLKAIQPTHEIKKILSVTNLQAYVQAMQPYTAFQQKFILYDAAGDTIKYSYNTESVTMVAPAAEDFEHFNSHFLIHVNQISKALNAIQDKVDAYDHTLKGFYAQQRTRSQTQQTPT
jgi:hypothetical protein